MNFAEWPPGGLQGFHGVSSFGATFGWNLVESFALEATLGLGFDAASHSGTPSDAWPGITAMTVARGVLPISRSGRHALTVAAGPLLDAGGIYGTVVFAHAELAYEYRFPGSFTMLLGFGFDAALNDSKHTEGDGCGFALFSIHSTGGCVASFHPGSLLPHLRLAVGYTY